MGSARVNPCPGVWRVRRGHWLCLGWCPWRGSLWAANLEHTQVQAPVPALVLPPAGLACAPAGDPTPSAWPWLTRLGCPHPDLLQPLPAPQPRGLRGPGPRTAAVRLARETPAHAPLHSQSAQCKDWFNPFSSSLGQGTRCPPSCLPWVHWPQACAPCPPAGRPAALTACSGQFEPQVELGPAPRSFQPNPRAEAGGPQAEGRDSPPLLVATPSRCSSPRYL